MLFIDRIVPVCGGVWLFSRFCVPKGQTDRNDSDLDFGRVQKHTVLNLTLSLRQESFPLISPRHHPHGGLGYFTLVHLLIVHSFHVSGFKFGKL